LATLIIVAVVIIMAALAVEVKASPVFDHANLIARLPQEHQADAFEQCWRKDWQDKEPHLLPAKHLSAWIQANLYLNLAEAPFDREDTTLNPAAGACVTCPRRSGYNTSLFADVQGDQCLDAPCFQLKITAHIDREIASRPELVQIETAWRSPKEQRPGTLQKNQYCELDIADNPDADPPCGSTKSAIIVFGKLAGHTLIVCTDTDCPVHNPHVAAQRAADPPPTIAPEPEQETEEEAAERQAEYEQRKAEYDAEQQRKEEERKQEFERQQQEFEAEQSRRTELRNARQATFERILTNAPDTFTVPQLRVFLSALVNLDPYDFAEDVAEYYVGGDENSQQTPEEVLFATVRTLPDEKLTSFALRLVLTGHTDIPREGDFDFLAQAEAAFVLPQQKKTQGKKQKPTVIKEAKPSPKKATPSKKKIAA
jgi:ParB family transcriptional regulator, chromosome partitioning protein